MFSNDAPDESEFALNTLDMALQLGAYWHAALSLHALIRPRRVSLLLELTLVRHALRTVPVVPTLVVTAPLATSAWCNEMAYKVTMRML